MALTCLDSGQHRRNERGDGQRDGGDEQAYAGDCRDKPRVARNAVRTHGASACGFLLRVGFGAFLARCFLDFDFCHEVSLTCLGGVVL